MGTVPAWAEGLVRLLDNAFTIPGTRIRIGLDPILGFIAPGAGDAASALVTSTLLWLGFKLRVPKVIILRMLVNIGVDALVGAIPLVGDLFDVAFRAGEKNIALIRKHGGQSGTPPQLGDYLVLAFCLFCMLCLLALPVVTGVLLIHLFVGFTRD